MEYTIEEWNQKTVREIEEWNQKTVRELRVLAKRWHIPRYSRMRKRELIEALRGVSAPSGRITEEEDWNRKTVVALRAIAKKRNIPRYSRLRKHELIQALIGVVSEEEKRPEERETIEAAFQAQVRRISDYLQLSPEIVEACLRSASKGPECEEVWKVANDTFLVLPEDLRWEFALEWDAASLAQLCNVSRAMNEMCQSEAFWQAKFRKDVGRKEKYEHHEDESWQRNYHLAFEHNGTVFQDLNENEIRLLAFNHEVDVFGRNMSSIVSDLVAKYPFERWYQIQKSMITLVFPTTRDDVAVRVEKDTRRISIEGHRIVALPPELFLLDKLELLRIARAQLLELPPEIGHLFSLQHLDLSENLLTTLPREIGSLSSLIFFDLSQNQLTSLPEEIGDLSSLESLNVSSNRLTSLPSSIGNLSSLRNLYLAANQLAVLPREIQFLFSLEILDLASNQFMIATPEIADLPVLQSVNFTGNREITLPPQIGDLVADPENPFLFLRMD